MLKRLITRLFGESNNKVLVSVNRELYGLDNLEDDAIGYPPNPIGIPVVQTHVLLNRMQENINAIQNEIGLSKETFDEYLAPVFENFIRFADLLPASEYKHHATGGGLIAHSLDVAHRAMRAAQMTHFPVTIGSLTETQQSNVQWRTGTVLAALLHDGGKVLADVQVHDGKAKVSDRIVWDAQSGQTIHDWAADNNVDRYFITWNRDRHMAHQNASLVVMERLIPAKTWSWLEKCYDGKQVHAMMLASVGKTNMSHPMPQIIAEADSASTKADMFSRNSHITKEIKRVPLSELFSDLIKHYLLTRKWRINEKSALVWFVDEQLYIVWSNAAPELVEEMNNAGYSVPAVPEVLARIMIEEGHAVANGDEPFFDLYPEILGDAKKPVKIKVLKMRNIQRFVLEPEKLYSLKEHPKRPAPVVPQQSEEMNVSEPEASVPNTEIIEEIFEEDFTISGNQRKQKTHETSKETLGRLLVNLSKQFTKKKAVRNEQCHFVETELDAQHEEMIAVPTQSELIEEQEINESDGATKNVPLEQQQQSAEAEETHSTVQFKDPIANFIVNNFDFEIKENLIQVPSDLIMQVSLKINDGGFKFAMMDIYGMDEVEVCE